MKRREFLAATGVAGLASLTAGLPASAAEAPGTPGTPGPAAGRDYLEVRRYLLATGEETSEDQKNPDLQKKAAEQKTALDGYWRDAAIPALNRLGFKPVGAFYPQQGLGPLYVVLRHKALADLVSATHKLLADAEFVAKAGAVLTGPKDAPPYKRLECSLLLAFTGMPELATPAQGAERVFQLRIYESPSVACGQKKIEMFNTAEIAIFRKVGLNPVFFGEALVGPKLPNLTYMLGFNNAQDQQDGWKKFGGDPDWQKLRKMPEYADNKILSNITNIVLKPAEYSQI